MSLHKKCKSWCILMRIQEKIFDGIIRRYNSISVQIRASIWFMVCVFLQRGISMITTPIFTRLISQEEYGLSNTFYSLDAVLEIFVSLEVASCATVLYAREQYNKEEVLSSLSSLSFLLTTSWLIIAYIFRSTLISVFGISTKLYICLFINIIATQITQLWMGYNRFVYRYRASVIVTLLTTVFSSIFSIVCVSYFGPTAENKILPSVATSLIIALLLYVNVLKRGHRFYSNHIWRFAFSYGIPLLPHYISQYVLSSSDRLMIGYMCGQKEVALYSISYAVGSIISMITYAINASFAPYQFQHIKSKEYNNLSRTANLVLVLVGALLGMIMLFSREIVLFFGGTKYLDSTSIIVPICLGTFFNYLFQLFARVEEFYLHKMMLSMASISCALLNIVLNYLTIPLFGYKAAAYTTFICYFAFCIVHFCFYKRVLSIECNNDKIYDIKAVALISVSVIFTGIISYLIREILIIKITVIILICVLFILYWKRISRQLYHLFK